MRINPFNRLFLGLSPSEEDDDLRIELHSLSLRSSLSFVMVVFEEARRADFLGAGPGQAWSEGCRCLRQNRCPQTHSVAGCVVVFKTVLQLFSKQVRELNMLDPPDEVEVVEESF